MGSSNYTTGNQGQLHARNLSSRIYIEEKGNWVQLVRALDSLPKEVKREAFNAMRSYGLKYERSLKRTIRANGANLKVPWPAYSEKYSIYKASHKPAWGANAMYRWTGTLYNALHTTTNRNLFTVTVSVKPVKAGRKKHELNAAQIALILDTGSPLRGIHPRPLFHPTWVEMGGNAAMGKFVTEILNKTVNNHLIHIR